MPTFFKTLSTLLLVSVVLRDVMAQGGTNPSQYIVIWDSPGETSFDSTPVTSSPSSGASASLCGKACEPFVTDAVPLVIERGVVQQLDLFPDAR